MEEDLVDGDTGALLMVQRLCSALQQFDEDDTRNEGQDVEQFTFALKHKAGTSNRVVDALSRRHNLLSTMALTVPGFDSFREMLEADSYFAAVLAVLQTGEKSDYLMVKGFLFRGNQLCIPNCSLRLQIVKELHGEGHVGRDRTLQLIRASYFWPTIRKEVERYVERYRVCQMSKGKATNAGLYMPLPIPTQPWTEVSTNPLWWYQIAYALHLVQFLLMKYGLGKF
ncbi:hypothetical protein LWI29_035357 [Acer saccharum]|uniref:Integrase zinc-binding domain-containing protein n=1 Tax=Acer saccharum TaxID=4024 RepID=A0AA39SPN7_ACESA|nr:hypothetical protein LWI29_035357 [Acer saccharum]